VIILDQIPKPLVGKIVSKDLRLRESAM
jgi:hypothetical protein